MKISHSIIALTAFIFVVGSMITVSMDLKKTTTNVSINTVDAKKKHNDNKEENMVYTQKHREDIDKINQSKVVYKTKSEWLSQHHNRINQIWWRCMKFKKTKLY